MSKLYLCNYADFRYKAQQDLNTRSAYEKGKVDKVLEFYEEDIADLKAEHPEHFKTGRGGGLWLWKPYIILKALAQINYGDYLFYCDTGAVFIDDLHKMLPDFHASGKDLMLVEQPLLAHCYTKKECYHLMGWNDYSGNQVLGGYILMRKSDAVIGYMQEWLENMADIRKSHGDHYMKEIGEFDEFIQHREDQSVLNILRQKWGVEAHRDPSDFGEFPWQYMGAGGYHSKKYPNSHYPTILLCVRQNDPVAYERTYREAVRRHKIGLNTEWTARLFYLPMNTRHFVRMTCRRMGVENLLNKLMGKKA